MADDLALADAAIVTASKAAAGLCLLQSASLLCFPQVLQASASDIAYHYS